MLPFSGEKSGQVLVRTPEGKNPSQMRLGRRSATRISRSELQRFKLHSDPDQKSGQVLVRTLTRKTPSQMWSRLALRE
jgi:hypothetical protein